HGQCEGIRVSMPRGFPGRLTASSRQARQEVLEINQRVRDCWRQRLLAQRPLHRQASGIHVPMHGR
ncbi:hypothetical protein PFISCL1PPCAC_11148, partial [Pristionchus fissidentatus]